MTQPTSPTHPGPAPAGVPEEVFFPESWVRPQSKFIEVEELAPEAAWAEWEAAVAAQERGDKPADFPPTQVLPLD